jgi:hypothetical protein
MSAGALPLAWVDGALPPRSGLARSARAAMAAASDALSDTVGSGEGEREEGDFVGDEAAERREEAGEEGVAAVDHQGEEWWWRW